MTVLADTELRSCGRVAEEIRAPAAAGVPPDQAIGAAS
jgi:hypothetical protein